MLRRRSGSYAALALVVVLLVPASAHSECFMMTAKDVLSLPNIEQLFAGRVIEITRTAEVGYRAAFEVDTVWKGAVPRRFELYVWEIAPEMPRFEKGRRYVAAARRLTDPKAKHGVGVGASDIVYTPTTCSGSFVPQIEAELGRGYSPTNPPR